MFKDLLNFCDLEKRATLQEPEWSDADSDFQDDVVTVLGGGSKSPSAAKKRKLAETDEEANRKKVRWKDLEENENLSVDESNDSELADDGEEDEVIDSDHGESIKVEKLKNDKKSNWEDIYGRVRDKDGNVIVDSASKVGKYVPPAQRVAASDDDGKNREMLERIKRQLKGHLNRSAFCPFLNECVIYSLCHDKVNTM